MSYSNILNLEQEVSAILEHNILSFWKDNMVDYEMGGFYGRINGDNNLIPAAEKGGILNARILWTFAAAFRELKNPAYLKIAKRAHDYIVSNFFDNEFGGTYWSLKDNGEPLSTKKQIYSQAFFMYALVEYYKFTGDKGSLEKSIDLFQLIERHSFHKEKGGYLEAFSRDWNLLDDLRLSAKDFNEKKTMNTHLHILEAYTNLYRVWKDSYLAVQLEGLIIIFLDKIINTESNHLELFFDENWNRKSKIISYGHDIEAAWLLVEAAKVLGKENIIQKVIEKCLKITQAAKEGILFDGSLAYEKDLSTGHLDKERHWWVQAEAVVGFLNAYELTGNEHYLEVSVKNWNYIKKNLIDYTRGEWHWSIKSDGTINHVEDKAGFWKCPYHNARMCLETINRVRQISIKNNPVQSISSDIY